MLKRGARCRGRSCSGGAGIHRDRRLLVAVERADQPVAKAIVLGILRVGCDRLAAGEPGQLADLADGAPRSTRSMLSGAARSDRDPIGAGACRSAARTVVMIPCGRDPAQCTPVPDSVNHRLSSEGSGDDVEGPLAAAVASSEYSVITPLVVIRPILPEPFSVNQRLPSGPAVIPQGKADAVGTANSVIDPPGVTRAIRSCRRLGDPEVAVGAGGDPHRPAARAQRIAGDRPARA